MPAKSIPSLMALMISFTWGTRSSAIPGCRRQAGRLARDSSFLCMRYSDLQICSRKSMGMSKGRESKIERVHDGPKQRVKYGGDTAAASFSVSNISQFEARCVFPPYSSRFALNRRSQASALQVQHFPKQPRGLIWSAFRASSGLCPRRGLLHDQVNEWGRCPP